ncbi:cytochrome P450 [Streptomyces sp. NPDC087845]|uniref:cytochrome P450 n=1 Tax=Streptomyces sp. NPDC087845 TaxID=3365806 RepID=UPI0037F868F5
MSSSESKFPFPEGPLATQPPEYVRRRTQCPLGEVSLPSGDSAMLAVRYDDVEAVMKDPRFTRDLSAPGSPVLFPADGLSSDSTFLVNMEGPDHRRLRRIVAGAFSPRRAEQWRPDIRAIIEELLDPIEKSGPPADLIATLAFPLPVRIICKQLGVPEEDSVRFREWVEAFLSVSGKSPEQRDAAMRDFTAYTVELIARHRAQPGDDLVDHLISTRDEDDRLSEEELVSMTRGLIVAGNETIANALSRVLLVLLMRPHVLESLRADPSLIPASIDELLRLNPPGRIGLLRMATEDVELPSGTVRAGQGVLSPLIAAGHDPEKFPDPEEFVLHREGPSSLVFGAGPHYCLGAHLARVELEEAVAAVIARFPTLRLTVPPEELPWSTGLWAVSLRGLPVTW